MKKRCREGYVRGVLRWLSGAVVVGALLISGVGVGVAGKAEEGKGQTVSKTLVLIGASYAGGWDSARPIAGYRMVNKGVNGQQSFEMLARFGTDVLALKPDAVIIWGYINDLFRSDPSQIDQTLMRTRESLLAMVELSRKAGVTPIIATEVTIRGKDSWSESINTVIGKILGKVSYQDFINRYVLDTNRWLREKAARENILLLDFESILADSNKARIKEFSQPDGSHISERGYEALTRYAENRLREVLETQ